MSRHKVRPPPDLSLGLVLHILLMHLLCSRRTFEVEDILMFASTKRNLCVSVCQVHILQSLRGDRGLRVTVTLQKNKQSLKQSIKVLT